MSRLAFVLVLCSILPSPVGAQETYRTPPAIVQHVLDAPRLPMLSTAPDAPAPGRSNPEDSNQR